MKRWKRTLRIAVKVVAAIAALVFIVANPFFVNGAIAFFLSIPVLLVCLLFWHLLGRDENGGYWPEKPPEQ